MISRTASVHINCIHIHLKRNEKASSWINDLSKKKHILPQLNVEAFEWMDGSGQQICQRAPRSTCNEYLLSAILYQNRRMLGSCATRSNISHKQHTRGRPCRNIATRSTAVEAERNWLYIEFIYYFPIKIICVKFRWVYISEMSHKSTLFDIRLRFKRVFMNVACFAFDLVIMLLCCTLDVRTVPVWVLSRWRCTRIAPLPMTVGICVLLLLLQKRLTRCTCAVCISYIIRRQFILLTSRSCNRWALEDCVNGMHTCDVICSRRHSQRCYTFTDGRIGKL